MIYTIIFNSWEISVDHIAYELILEQGYLTYNKLIHYPHEGGTIVVSLLALILESFTKFSSVSIAILLFDFATRFFQIYIVNKIFNNNILKYFILWTLVPGPMILGLSATFIGLHYICIMAHH